MSSAEPNDDFVAAAARASAAWGLEPTAIEVLSHSENVVCDVTIAGTGGTDEHLILRLHRPGYNSLDELESEVAWVAALRAAGLPVPTCRPTLAGGHYVEVEVEGEAGAERRQVGVVEWVDGEPLGGPVTPNEGPGLIVSYGRIGEIAAAIRAHHATWAPPPGFVRRRWDRAGLLGPAPLWGRFWEVERLTPAQRRLFAEARDVLWDRLGALPTDDASFGLIHADLHQGNVMADGERLTIIDFDDAGFGWFAHELAVALHPVLEEPPFEAALDALIAGHRRIHPMGDDEVETIHTFLTIRSLMIIGWLDQRAELPIYEHFDELAAQAERVAGRYLATGRV